MNRNLIIVVFAVLALMVVIVAVTVKPRNPMLAGINEPKNTTNTGLKGTTTQRPGKGNTTGRPFKPGSSEATLNSPLQPLENPNSRLVKRTPAPGQKDKFAGEDALRAAIFGGDPVKREEALQQLAGNLQNGDGLNVLKELFQSTDKDLQQEALALIPNADEKYRLPLIMIGMDNPEQEYRMDTLNLLRDIAEVDVNPILIKALSDKDPEILEEVSSLFFYFIDKPIYEAVALGLKNENEQVREEALRYLEDVHTVKSVDMQLDLLGTGDKEFQERIGDSLRFITNADINSNDPNEWKTWWKANRDEWAKEFETEMEGWGSGDGTAPATN